MTYGPISHPENRIATQSARRVGNTKRQIGRKPTGLEDLFASFLIRMQATP
jgi:hypothetical protein